MRSRIIRGAVLVSTVALAAAVGFIIFSAVQEDDTGAPIRLVAVEGYEPSEEDLESFIPGDHISIMAIQIEAVTASCSDGDSHLLFESQEPLLSGAEIVLTPSSPAFGHLAEAYSPVSDSFRATVDEPGARFDIVLPASVRMIEYDVMTVTAWATEQDGTLIRSNVVLLDREDVGCL